MKHRFKLTFTGSAILELDDRVIKAVDDAWRASLYDLHTPEEIAEMVGANMILGGVRLSRLDGWADQPDENAEIIEEPDWRTEVRKL